MSGPVNEKTRTRRAVSPALQAVEPHSHRRLVVAGIVAARPANWPFRNYWKDGVNHPAPVPPPPPLEDALL